MLIVADGYFTSPCENVTKVYFINYIMNQCGSTCNDLTNNFIVTLNTTDNITTITGSDCYWARHGRELRCVQKSNSDNIIIKISPSCEILLKCYCYSNDSHYCNYSFMTISETCDSMSQILFQQTSNAMQANSCFINISAYLNNTTVPLKTNSMGCTSKS